jgi:nucleoside-diphosphate-sugar epimerase
MPLTMRDAPDTTIVTGATGWFGRALLAALTDSAGPHVRRSIRALVTTPSAAGEVAAGIDPIVGDVRTSAGLGDLFADIPSGHTVDVIHAAGVIHPRTPSEWVEVNARGTANVAAKAREAGVRRLVHVSSNSPFGVNPHPGDVFRNDEPYDPYLGYGRSKMLAELRLLDEVANGLDAVIVRPPWFYGPHQPARQTTFFTMVRKGRFPIVGDGRQRRSMVYVEDLVYGVIRAELAQCPAGRGWWIADARPYELNEIVSSVTDALAAAGLDVAARQLHVPSVVSRAAAAADAALQRRHRYAASLHVLGELGTTIACDISAARHELGYEPSVGLAEGMRRSVEWCLANGIEL